MHTESSENFPVQIGKKYNIKKTGESNILDNVNLFDNFMLYKYPKLLNKSQHIR
mgnify:FL=1